MRFLWYNRGMKQKDINEQIAKIVGKSPLTVKDWKVRQPELYSLAEIGAFCISNGLDRDKIEKIIELRDAICGKEE